ncbi:4-(cytidine 5'-diphospho)-2-C-methyl-D-erythritol kinase [Gracilimonas mengyeensis]|uniref:4-diphosphocytidyl-2-C-methyl-D-erythritol kinase n=1 Tax=Gracilimonas mengyeensis TaxID=1302730 RepID=A0A521BUA4_9BACT|nr:4-(cytidine 5'-diphospho)-2-C-methyl-D-erythritol kinase [Gracilimonas mengyeensis]SMO50738.1 4-diphosphocytidyl-2-C-methyl-D-erythritol kinase [Gracilimonas mengyeensis]
MAELWISNSYAKINLGLNVIERLDDGYHAIETGFCFIEWNDRFEVKPSGRMDLEMSDEKIPVDDRNLIVQAVKLLQKEAGLKDEFHIKVEKNIPTSAGLGGGSSNAATILRMMNKIANLGLSQEDLIKLGGRIGADVPFFLKGEPGLGTGRGDDIEPLDIQPDSWIVTVYPNIESSTAEAYQFCEPAEPEFSLKNVLVDEEPDEWRYLLMNDLEKSVFPRLHLVGNVKDQMYEFGAEYASMSGSGSSVFGVFEQDFVAINAYESFHKLGFPANLTRPGFKPDQGIYLKEG